MQLRVSFWLVDLTRFSDGFSTVLAQGYEGLVNYSRYALPRLRCCRINSNDSPKLRCMLVHGFIHRLFELVQSFLCHDSTPLGRQLIGVLTFN